MSFIALIPARSGSQRIKNKNLYKIKSKPLIYYTIKAAKKSKFINKIYVLTDSQKIKKVAESYGAEVPFLRPKKISLASSKMVTTIRYCLKKINTINQKYFILLQPTSPLRVSKDIDNACRLILSDKKASGLVSTFRMKDIFFSKLMFKKKNYIYRLDSKIKFNELSVFVRNGPSIYIGKIKKNFNFYNGKILNYVLPEKTSLDIDTIKDIKKLKKILNLI